MNTNFELTDPFANTLPVSLVSTANASPAIRRARMTNPRPTAKAEVRLALIASLRRRIAAGTYRITAMQLADSMFESVFTA